jgi:hypothetical protein
MLPLLPELQNFKERCSMPTQTTARPLLAITKLALPTLAGMRSRGEGPEYIKVTPGKAGRVRYWQKSVREWMNARRA